ncbi:DUF2785 domain-containing protein [Nocardioides lentus]|uniref:DUF2785 domain-containing protein n=1 Tax=Nocardioides lentus TaxID=338077 RepID=A0ABP5B4S6_9ACTN
MRSGYWQQVLAGGLRVPGDRPLDDLTAELTSMLGSPDPDERDATAYPALATWVGRGVYDDLLAGLGDGMAAGLRVGIGGRDGDTVFRRSFSALVLAECIDRDNAHRLLPGSRVLEWGDRLAGWFLREQDVRGFVPGKGWAHAVAHGADALGVLARSPHLGTPELTVLLDVMADRLTAPASGVLMAGEPDRMAAATMRVLRRNQVPITVLEPWVRRVTAVALDTSGPGDPYRRTADAEAYLRALHLQVALSPDQPACRADLLLVLVEALRRTNADLLRAGV